VAKADRGRVACHRRTLSGGGIAADIAVPSGYYRGLPVGISFLGRAWSEPTLIKLAYAYEQATRHRKPPAFAATANLTQP
jgi:hypothetical protein